MQKDAQLEQHITTIQQLTTQLREKDERLRQGNEELQRRATQLHQKDEELQQKMLTSADFIEKYKDYRLILVIFVDAYPKGIMSDIASMQLYIFRSHC